MCPDPQAYKDRKGIPAPLVRKVCPASTAPMVLTERMVQTAQSPDSKVPLDPKARPEPLVRRESPAYPVTTERMGRLAQSDSRVLLDLPALTQTCPAPKVRQVRPERRETLDPLVRLAQTASCLARRVRLDGRDSKALSDPLARLATTDRSGTTTSTPEFPTLASATWTTWRSTWTAMSIASSQVVGCSASTSRAPMDRRVLPASRVLPDLRVRTAPYLGLPEQLARKVP